MHPTVRTLASSQCRLCARCLRRKWIRPPTTRARILRRRAIRGPAMLPSTAGPTRRLIALGYIQTGSSAIRPITRVECARLVVAAHALATDEDPLEDSSGVGSLLLALDREFAHEAHVVHGEPTQAVPSKVSMRATTGSPALVARIRGGNGLG